MNPIEIYTQLRDGSANKVTKLKSQLTQLSMFRLGSFLTTAAIVYFLWQYTPVAVAGFIAGTAAFLYLVRLHAAKKEELLQEKSYLSLAEEAVIIASGDWRNRDGGAQYADPLHPYTSDLNVFGRHSLFQYLNRTQTPTAQNLLAGWLKENIKNENEILKHREIIDDFASEPDWILRYLSHARRIDFSQDDISAVEQWSSEKEFTRSPRIWTLTTRILPILMIASVVSYFMKLISWNTFLLTLLVPAAVVIGTLSVHQQRFRKLLNLLQDVSANEGMLEMLRKKDFSQSPFSEKIERAELKGSLAAISGLRSIVGAIESRNNVVVAILLNLTLLWDFQCARRLDVWKTEHGVQLVEWLRLIRETEAWLSLATFRFNHPNYQQPELAQENDFDMQDARHPLMSHEAIPNDLDLSDQVRLSIITGANMAGKSTYLRTVGLNLVLAMRGLPVPVEFMRFKPVQLYTSMLAADSLGDNESYFFSELKRLRQMTDALETGSDHFVILDEILKGTNSTDKAEGSRKFLRKLLSLPAKGLIATHDLSLCTMADMHPGVIINQKFEVGFKKDELDFDYKLQPGVCENMNASFLLKKMGLVID